MQTLQKNPFSDRVNLFFRLSEEEKLKAEVEKKSFAERMKPMRNGIIYFMLPLTIIWSVATEISFLGTEFYNMTNSLFWTAIGTTLLVSLVELSKLLVGTAFFKFLTNGWLKDGGYYQIYFVPTLIWALLAYGGSVFMSINGAPSISKNISSYTNEIDLINLDSINQHFNARLLPYQDIIEHSKNTKWKGSITRDAMKSINKNTEIIESLETQRISAIQQAETENKERQSETASDVSEWGLWLKGFGGVGEGIQVLCLLMLSIYNRAATVEMFQDERQAETAETLETPQFQDYTNTNQIRWNQKNNTTSNRVVVQGFRKENPVKASQNFISEPIIRTTVIDVSKLITNIRNWYRRKDDRYTSGKQRLEALGYQVTEINDSSLQIKKVG